MKKILALLALAYASTSVAATSPDVEIQYHLVHEGKIVAQGQFLASEQPVRFMETRTSTYLKSADEDGKGAIKLNPGQFTTGFIGQIQLLEDGRLAVYANNTAEAAPRASTIEPPVLKVNERLVRLDLKKNASTAIRVGELGKDYTIFLSRVQ